MADLQSIEAKVDALIQGRYQDKEQILKALHEIKEEVIQVRSDMRGVVEEVFAKVEQTYVRKDVNAEKDKGHDQRLENLEKAQGEAKTESTALKVRIDRFAIVGGTLATALAVFKQDIANLLKIMFP